MNKTCYEMLVDGVDLKKGCLIFNDHKIGMKQFLRNIDDFAISLKNIGFKKRDVLTLYLPTCPQALVAFYACSKLGVVANIVHPLMPFDKLKENLAQTKSKGIVYYDILIKNPKELGKLNQILISCSISNYVFFRKAVFSLISIFKCSGHHLKGKHKFSKLIKHSKNEQAVKVYGKADDVVCTMHSGGTSGQPKIIELTNYAFNDLSVSLEKMYTRKIRGGGSEFSLVALPIFHAYGLGVSVHTCLTNQYSLILVPKFKPKTFNNLIRRYNVTFFAGVPVMFKKMIEHKNFYGKHLQKLKDLWCGGDVLTESFVEHFDTILEKYNCSARLFRGYGLTEVSSVCAANTFENYKPFSCGKAIPNTKIEIWDEQNKPLKPKTIGEIAVASPSVMKGYLNEVNGFVYKDKLKWIKTGDMGYMDEDGFLYILDRRKRSIKINAINVFPSEIENLVKKIDAIDEACAVPYHYNDKTYIKLYVTVKSINEETFNEEKIKKEILNLCKNNLIKYSVPRMIEIIDAMPRTDFGKIDFKKFEIS